ncbi:carbonic anhydrase family protein [Variovorax sp. HJSM1_2]|uniref:carbonic anhydrase n=1 Tax=Variovorax sp. HJSM1_2 TaxID=3366263 RepID=UPI003BE1DB87
MKPTSLPLSAKPLPIWRAVAWLGASLVVSSAAMAADAPASAPAPASRIPSPAKPVTAPPTSARSQVAAPTAAAGTEKPMSIADQVRAAVEEINATPQTPPPRRSAMQSPRHRATNPVPRAPSLAVSPSPSIQTTAAAPARPATGGKSAVQPTPVSTRSSVDDPAQQQYLRARAAALGSFAGTAGAAAAVGQRSGTPAMRGNKQEQAPELPWAYSGDAGPQAWAKLKPEFATCGAGQRQSPIAIDDSTALAGPAEPLTLNYKASNGSVVHTGRTLQVDVQGENFLTVRGTRYRLVSMDFQQPAEEIINGKSFAMGVHLLHRSEDGQQAMLAVLLEPGEANAMIDQVWTYVPLDVADRVAFPAGGLNVASLLPQDPRYYQFFGSLTAPPCTEGVLWMVMRQPTSLSASQLRLFTQLFPNNARPVQPVNARVVRAAQ